MLACSAALQIAVLLYNNHTKTAAAVKTRAPSITPESLTPLQIFTFRVLVAKWGHWAPRAFTSAPQRPGCAVFPPSLALGRDLKWAVLVGSWADPEVSFCCCTWFYQKQLLIVFIVTPGKWTDPYSPNLCRQLKVKTISEEEDKTGHERETHPSTVLKGYFTDLH